MNTCVSQNMPIFCSSFTIKCSVRLPAQAIWNPARAWLEIDTSVLKFVWKDSTVCSCLYKPLLAGLAHYNASILPEGTWALSIPHPHTLLCPAEQLLGGASTWQCIKQTLMRLQSLCKACGALLGLPLKHKHTLRVLFLSCLTTCNCWLQSFETH